MTKKSTTEEFIRKALSKHGNKYDYSLVNYINSSTKIVLICKEHGKFLIRPNEHLSKGAGCKKCSGCRVNSTETFIEKANLAYGDTYDYSLVEYIDKHTKVKIICKEHGVFEVYPRRFLIKYSICHECSGYKYSTATLQEKLNSIHNGNLVLTGEYIGNVTNKQNVHCNVCNYEWMVAPHSLLKGRGCPSCSKCVWYTTESFIKAIKEKYNGDFTFVEGQIIKGLSNKYKFKHKCGYEWITSATNVLSKGGCANCSGKMPYNFESLREKVAEKHGGTISLIDGQEINGACNKYTFKHVCGNIWKTKASAILSGKGCPVCAISGFSQSKNATFYILDINGQYQFTGFGISNKIRKRMQQHSKNLRDNYCTILSKIFIESDGETIYNLEKYVKETLQCRNSMITGFRTESVLILPEELLIFCEDWLTDNSKRFKIRHN